MAAYVDIHAHVLPGIDDGPSDVEGTLELLRAAAAAGTSVIAATPHLRADFPDVHVGEIAERCKAVRDVIETEQIPIRVVSGAEVSAGWAAEADDDRLALASYGQRGRDLLIESPTRRLVGLDRFLYELRAKGYRITLAHPERNSDWQKDDDALRQLVEQGVLLQVNGGSLLRSQSDRRTRRFAETLVSEGVAHVLASDGHRGRSWRPVTVLSEAVEAAEALVGTERALWMAESVPAAIVEGGPLPEAPAIAAPGRPARRWFVFGQS
jgi:protein-tyrosine phosphatase